MAHCLDNVDVCDGESEIPEIDLSIQIQPYMYEPVCDNLEGERISSTSESDTEPDDNIQGQEGQDENESTWCKCERCRVMPTAKENKCCHSTNVVDGKIEEEGLKCITEHEGFVANCLNRYVLETSYYEFLQENGPLEEHERIHSVYRHLAYRRFVRWIFHRLGKKNRRILPSCVVIKIRETFPSQQYCGFQYPR